VRIMGYFDELEREFHEGYIDSVRYLDLIAKQHDSTIKATAHYLLYSDSCSTLNNIFYIEDGLYRVADPDTDEPPVIVEFFQSAMSMHTSEKSVLSEFKKIYKGLYFDNTELPIHITEQIEQQSNINIKKDNNDYIHSSSIDYQKRVAELEQQLADEKSNSSVISGRLKTEQSESKTNGQMIKEFEDRIKKIEVENHDLNNRLNTARNIYTQQQNKIKNLKQAESDNDQLRLNSLDNDKELTPKSQAKVACMLYAILKENDYDLSPPMGKGLTNDLIVTASKNHKTPITRNFVANWLKRVYQLDIDTNK